MICGAGTASVAAREVGRHVVRLNLSCIWPLDFGLRLRCHHSFCRPLHKPTSSRTPQIIQRVACAGMVTTRKQAAEQRPLLSKEQEEMVKEDVVPSDLEQRIPAGELTVRLGHGFARQRG